MMSRSPKGAVLALVIRILRSNEGVMSLIDLTKNFDSSIGSLSPVISRATYTSKKLKRSYLGRDLYVRLAHVPCPEGHSDLGHERIRQTIIFTPQTASLPPRIVDKIAPAPAPGASWVTDIPGKFPICCIVDGKPWFFTADAVKQLYSQLRALEGAFK